MTEQRHSRLVGATSIIKNPRIVAILESKRDEHNRVVTAEMKKEVVDYNVVNPNEDMAKMYHEAAATLSALIDQNEMLTEVLKRRVLVALAEAKAPEWVPTHRHYKGKLYRVTGTRWNADHEELEEQIEYDDADGKKYTLARRRWESVLESSGKPRYEFVAMVKSP